jgi:hypothetical protein
MKAILAMLCALAFAAAPVYAQDKAKGDDKKADKAMDKSKAGEMGKGDDKKKAPSDAQKAQQQRMADCNKTAGDKKYEGDNRKAFMKNCLAGKDWEPPVDKKKAQQEKMTACNAKAGDKKGDDRKKFMSECLKG